MDISGLQVKTPELWQGSAYKRTKPRLFFLHLSDSRDYSFPTHIASWKVWVFPPRMSNVSLWKNTQVLHLRAHEKPVMGCPSVAKPTFVSSTKDRTFCFWRTSEGLRFQNAATFSGAAKMFALCGSFHHQPYKDLSYCLTPTSAIKGKDTQSPLNRRVKSYKGSGICLTWRIGKWEEVPLSYRKSIRLNTHGYAYFPLAKWALKSQFNL